MDVPINLPPVDCQQSVQEFCSRVRRYIPRFRYFFVFLKNYNSRQTSHECQGVQQAVISASSWLPVSQGEVTQSFPIPYLATPTNPLAMPSPLQPLHNPSLPSVPGFQFPMNFGLFLLTYFFCQTRISSYSTVGFSTIRLCDDNICPIPKRSLFQSSSWYTPNS